MARPLRKITIRANGAGNGHHNTGKIVISAIKKLMKNTGWTARTIVKFIKMEYSINDPHLSRKVSRALKQGVRLGLLQTDRGRYRLNDVSALAQPSYHKHDKIQSPLRQRPEKPVYLRDRSSNKGNQQRKDEHYS